MNDIAKILGERFRASTETYTYLIVTDEEWELLMEQMDHAEHANKARAQGEMTLYYVEELIPGTKQVRIREGKVVAPWKVM